MKDFKNKCDEVSRLFDKFTLSVQKCIENAGDDIAVIVSIKRG